MEVKIKKLHERAVIPTYARKGDAGMDLTAVDKYYDYNGCVVYHTGLALEIPEGYVGLIFPRSSVCKKDLCLTNSVGVIDSGYRGEIILKYKPIESFEVNPKTCIDAYEERYAGVEGTTNPYDEYAPYTPEEYEIGDRIGQLIIMPFPQIEFKEVDELTHTERGSNGYGSTGK